MTEPLSPDLRLQKMQKMFPKRHPRIRGKVCILYTSLLFQPLSPLLNVSSDEYCPHCDNHFVLDAKTPMPTLNIEGEDVRVDARMLRDDRIREEQKRHVFDVDDTADRLG